LFFSKRSWTCHANTAGKRGAAVPSSTLTVVEWQDSIQSQRKQQNPLLFHGTAEQGFEKALQKTSCATLTVRQESRLSIRGEIRLETWSGRPASSEAWGEVTGTSCPRSTTPSCRRFCQCFGSSRCRKRRRLLTLRAVSWASSHPFLPRSCKGSDGYII